MPQEIYTKIDEFAAFLPTIYEMPMRSFENELHLRLNDIVAGSDNYPQQRKSIRQMLFERTDKELIKGYMNSQMRLKPFGYAGDFRVIDWMYKRVYDPELENQIWDDFCHEQHAGESVRNRKEHLKNVITGIVARKKRPIKVLDFASGPCRDIAEAIDLAGEGITGSFIHLVDIEPKAIEYAQKVTKPYAKIVNFRWECANVFRFRSEERYDLVWSAGLFDYLNDKLATALIAKMWQHTAEGGEMIVGNFHPRNPTRNYMEWCMDWLLIHRTEDELTQLGIAAGIPEKNITIEQEPLGVCIFLRARK